VYRRKAGVDVFLLCGCIFAPIGTLFLVIPIFLTLSMDYVAAHGEGDVWILPFIFGLLGAILAVIEFWPWIPLPLGMGRKWTLRRLSNLNSVQEVSNV